MKKLAIILSVLIMFSFTAGMAISGQWIVCDPAPENADADPDNDVVDVIVRLGGTETSVVYSPVAGGAYVVLAELTEPGEVYYEFAFKNSQGRRGNFVGFTVQPQPGGCSGIRILND